MTFLQELPVPEWAALVPLALALGVVMYLTLLGLAVVPHVPAVPPLPGDLEFLATPSVMVPAALLYLLGWMVRRRRIPELVWEGGNVGVRAIAAGLLALLVIPEGGVAGKAAAALGTGVAAGLLQLLRLGWITLDHQGGIVPARRWIQKLGADTGALGLLWLTLLSPGPAALLAGVVLVALAAGGGPAYRAGRLSLVALVGLFRVAAGRSGWRHRRALPSRVARRVRSGHLDGKAGIRAAPAALLRRDGGRSFQDGWLVASAEGPWFLPRSGRVREGFPLAHRVIGVPIRSPLLTEVELRDPGGDMILMVPVGGPGPEELAGVFERFENL
ncbi:MAG: hypothetical protein WD804_02440 [Gemmatimonadota bacterium]